MRLISHRPARDFSKVYAGALLITGILPRGAKRKPPPAAAPPEVTVAPVVQRAVADFDEATGHFESVNAVEIRPRVSGYLQRVGFVEGAMVHEGDLLFAIDPRPYEAEV